MTNLLDVPAEVIGLIFSHRWAIEIFFRFFKHMLGCRHLLSHDQNGIEIQTYCAIIACMLIALWTGKKPTLRTFEMICFYMAELVLFLDGGCLMSKSFRVRARRASDTVISSMSFGSLFILWLTTTSIIAVKRGLFVAGYSVEGYLVLWIVVAIAGWLLEDRSASK